jgi:hypothetical protein
MAERPPRLYSLLMTRVSLTQLFGARPPLVGMVHLLPLPGAPHWNGSMKAVIERALADAHALAEAGMDGLLVENFGDSPFYPERVPAETVAAMALVAGAVRSAIALPLGINVLRNDARAALAIAAATGAEFLRCNVHTGGMFTDQGWIPGRAYRTLRMRARLGLGCAILADVAVKHATPPAGHELAAEARDAWHRGLADALIVSGPATGQPVDTQRLRTLRQAVPDAPLFIGSGADAANIGALLPLADGVIVGSSLQQGGKAGQPVMMEQARAFVSAARAARP